MACSPAGLDCAYPQGQCNCTYTLPVGGNMPVWTCFTPTNCPEPRPRIGSACSSSGTTAPCDYGACSGGIELQCSGGYWKEVLVPCPG
jgi:hypothetical protein